ncbi:hypothetical protein tb265_41010 [Gemmatimonadetes bacterium T265]|nr:hypothetical protein tb265_41010 [Gemmatimonadetes bacterium T265]
MRSTSNRGPTLRTPIPSVRAVGLLFVALGVLDVWRGVAPLFGSARPPRLAGDDVLVLAIGVAALIGGDSVRRGRNWARWLLAGWMALHVVVSAGRPAELGAHVVIFGAVAFLLFRARAATSFTAAGRA